MGLRYYVGFLRRRWLMLLAGIILASSAAFIASRQLTPMYEAHATLLLNLAPQPALPTLQDVTTSQALTKTYAILITSPPVLEETVNHLRGQVSLKDLERVSGSTEPQTQIIYVRYRDSDPMRSALVVNTVASVFADRIRTAQLGNSAGAGQSGSNQSINTVFIAAPAKIPESPVFPSIPLFTVLGGLVGLILTAAIVAVIEYLDDSVKDKNDLEQLGLSELGRLGNHRNSLDEQLSKVGPKFLQSGMASEYQQLLTNMEFAASPNRIQSLLITSAMAGEGKTTTSCNLAIVLATMGLRVILVDTDLRRPSIHKVFGLSNDSGLTNAFLAEEEEVHAVVSRSLRAGPVENLQIITSGRIPPNPARLLNSHRMVNIMKHLSDLVDVVLYDSPPVLATADVTILAGRVDALLLVIYGNHTRRGAIESTVETLQRTGVNIIGAVLNRTAPVVKEYTGYGSKSKYEDITSDRTGIDAADAR